MFRIKLLLLTLWMMVAYANHQKYPGTKTRPVLSDAEAAQYTKAKYLSGWNPETISHNRVDYTVGSGHLSHIQEAVNAAVKAGGTKRKYIHVLKGTYKQIVFIPKTTVPITIFGTAGNAADVVITMTQGAGMKGSTWANQANPGGKVFKNGDPAWSMFEGCAKRDTIGTFCSQVVWSQANNLELAYLTIDNREKDGQAVALSLDADMQNVDNLHIYGFQDTLFLSGTRAYISRSTIKGDVDFIFGGGAAVLEQCTIIGRGDRPRNQALIFAPNTDIGHKYGFLVEKCHITADGNVKSHKGLGLARCWDSSARANGQLIIRESTIDDVINANTPYGTSAGGHPFSGNINKNRNLDDAHYNRFWEYKNNGGGS